MKQKIVSKKALAPIEIKASKRRLFQTGNPSLVLLHVQSIFFCRVQWAWKKPDKNGCFPFFTRLNDLLTKICSQSKFLVSRWMHLHPLKILHLLLVGDSSFCKGAVAGVTSNYLILFGCFVIFLNLRGSLRCKEKCEFSHHPNPRKLQPRGISRLIHDFEHFRSAQWKRWPDYTSRRTSMEPRNEKENHLTIHFHFGVPAVRDDHAPDQKERPKKIHKKPQSKEQPLIFANLTTSIKQVLSARNRKLSLCSKLNPMFFTSLDTWMYVDYGSSRACPS